MRRISAGRSVFGFFKKFTSQRALHGTAFPGQVGRHVAAAAVDRVATEAMQVVHQLPRLARRADSWRACARNAQRRPAGCARSVCASKGCRPARPPARPRACTAAFSARCRKTAACGSSPRCSPASVCATPGANTNLRQRAAADGGEFRSEVIRLLDAVDLVASRAAAFDHQGLAVRDLRRVAVSKCTLPENRSRFWPPEIPIRRPICLASKR